MSDWTLTPFSLYFWAWVAILGGLALLATLTMFVCCCVHRGTIKKQKQSIEDLEAQNEKKRSEIESLRGENAGLQATASELRKQRAELNAQVSELTTENGSLSVSLATKVDELQSLNAECMEWQITCSTLGGHNSRLRYAATQAELEAMRLTAELDRESSTQVLLEVWKVDRESGRPVRWSEFPLTFVGEMWLPCPELFHLAVLAQQRSEIADMAPQAQTAALPEGVVQNFSQLHKIPLISGVRRSRSDTGKSLAQRGGVFADHIGVSLAPQSPRAARESVSRPPSGSPSHTQSQADLSSSLVDVPSVLVELTFTEDEQDPGTQGGNAPQWPQGTPKGVGALSPPPPVASPTSWVSRASKGWGFSLRSPGGAASPSPSPQGGPGQRPPVSVLSSTHPQQVVVGSVTYCLKKLQGLCFPHGKGDEVQLCLWSRQRVFSANGGGSGGSGEGGWPSSGSPVGGGAGGGGQRERVTQWGDSPPASPNAPVRRVGEEFARDVDRQPRVHVQWELLMVSDPISAWRSEIGSGGSQAAAAAPTRHAMSLPESCSAVVPVLSPLPQVSALQRVPVSIPPDASPLVALRERVRVAEKESARVGEEARERARAEQALAKERSELQGLLAQKEREAERLAGENERLRSAVGGPAGALIVSPGGGARGLGTLETMQGTRSTRQTPPRGDRDDGEFMDTPPDPFSQDANWDRFLDMCHLRRGMLCKDRVVEIRLVQQFNSGPPVVGMEALADDAMALAREGGGSLGMTAGVDILFTPSDTGPAVRFSRLNFECSNAERGALGLTVLPMTSVKGPPQQFIQSVSVEVRASFKSSPRCKLEIFLPDGGAHMISFTLPLFLSRFAAPLRLTPQAFLAAWWDPSLHVSQARLSVPKRFLRDTELLTALVTAGGALAVCERVAHPMAENALLAAGVLRFPGAGGDIGPRLVRLFLRCWFAAGQASGLLAVEVKADDPEVAEAVCSSLGTQLS